MKKTPYELHCERYAKGCGASICAGARNVCTGRGTLPADILFVGEGPGEGEDSLGEPFVGPAGHVLDQIIEEVLPESVPYAITNLVGCIPREMVDDGEGNYTYQGKATEPDDVSIEQCSGRLQEFIDLCNPKLLIAVGKIAGDYLSPGYRHGVNHRRLPVVQINHPAYILRQPFGHRSQMVTRCIIQVRDAVEAYILNPRSVAPVSTTPTTGPMEDDDLPF